ncbi:hypothetical protein Ancab_032608 [Ancistrocladus abbreviatus]
MCDDGQGQKYGTKVHSRRVLNNLPRSFSNVVKGKIPNSAKHDDIRKMGDYQEDEDRMWLKDCWYGKVFSIEDLLGLESKIKESGVMDCNLRFLGGKGVLPSSNGIDSNTRDHKCLEFARILLHTSPMSMINSKLKIRINGDIVPVWVAKEATMFDRYDILSRFNEQHLMFSASSSYVEDSLISQNSMGNRSLATKVVENHPTVVHSGEEGAAANLSITLQNGSRATDKGAGKGFSREIFESGDNCINGCNNYDKQGVTSSFLH